MSALPDDVEEGIRLFNAGQYFEAHEALERAWLGDRSAGRRLYQAILQVGVGLHHARRRNQRGALRLLDRGCDGLEHFVNAPSEVDVRRLLNDARRVRRTFATPSGVDRYDWRRRPRIRLQSPTKRPS